MSILPFRRHREDPQAESWEGGGKEELAAGHLQDAWAQLSSRAVPS